MSAFGILVLWGSQARKAHRVRGAAGVRTLAPRWALGHSLEGHEQTKDGQHCTSHDCERCGHNLQPQHVGNGEQQHNGKLGNVSPACINGR